MTITPQDSGQVRRSRPDPGSRGHIGWIVTGSLVTGLVVGLLLVAAPFIALLSLTIARVELVPWPGGDKPLRKSPRRRELRIEWAPATKDRAEAVVLAEPCPLPKPHRQVSEGRAEVMRELEAAKLREARRLRSERSRAYYREWNERRRDLRE